MYFNGGKHDHFAKTCKAPNKEDKVEAHNVNQIDNFVAMLFQMTSPSNNSDWWLDTCATCHVCTNKYLFFAYIAAKENRSKADHFTSVVLETGTVVLTLTLGKTLILKSMKQVPLIFKNLVFGSLLCIAGMRLDFQGRKVVLSYKKMYFACNAYHIDGMLKISTIAPTLVINEISTSLYSSTLWHNRLGHVNYRKMFNMKKAYFQTVGVISLKKYEVGVQAKITKKFFPNVTRTTNLLDLIHSDTCDFKSLVTRGSMKYFITFFNNHSRFCHVYLLTQKMKPLVSLLSFVIEWRSNLGVQ